MSARARRRTRSGTGGESRPAGRRAGKASGLRARTGRSGGPGGSAGFEFQHTVAAALAVRVLGETAGGPPWDLPANLELIRCESGERVDDVWLRTSVGGRVFLQAKQSIALSRSASSDLGKTLDDFVAQFREERLRPERDRLVLSLDGAPTWARDFQRVLERARAGENAERIAVTQSERKAASVVLHHVSDRHRLEADELITFLRLLRVETASRSDLATQSLTILGTAVVRRAEQALAAWDRLFGRVARLASTGQTGADRASLQQELIRANITVKAIPSYEADVERLKVESTNRLNDLKAYAMIVRAKGAAVHLGRPIVGTIKRLTQAGNLVITGAAGSGKSGVIHDLIRGLSTKRADVLVFPVDAYSGVQSVHDFRTKLHLEHDLVDVLAAWPGGSAAYVAIDGLDASRGGGAASAFRDLIAQVRDRAPRWKVIASVRAYDLREGLDLAGLFPVISTVAVDRELTDPAITGVRHVVVPALRDDDLATIRYEVPQLKPLLTRGPLRELLRNPFNLRVATALVDEGVHVSELTPIRTQIQLLDRYWRARARGDANATANEEVLGVICDTMISSQRLTVPRTVLKFGALAPTLDRLISLGVLNERVGPEGRFIGLAHHILFDYAVMNLVLAGNDAALAQRLRDQRRLALVVRPSIRMLFERLWHEDPSRLTYWRWVLRVCAEHGTPEVARLIGPGVAADFAELLVDMEPLLSALRSIDEAERHAANNALRHVLGALYVREPDVTRLVGGSAGPWAAAIEAASAGLFEALFYTTKTFIATAVQAAERMTRAQRSSVGVAARRLLQAVLDRVPRDPSLIGFAIQGVARTIASDVDASTALLNRVLTPHRLEKYGHEELRWLANEIIGVADSAPGLARDIYVATFGRQETSTEPTSMGDSQILPLTSNRRQDWEGVRYVLAEKFRKFVSEHPVEAAEAAMRVTDSYVAQEHPWAAQSGRAARVGALSRSASVRPDGSRTWAWESAYGHEDAVKILRAFDAYLRSEARKPRGGRALDVTLQVVAQAPAQAAIWTSVLRAAAQSPRTLGRELRSLAWAKALVETSDTYEAAAHFIWGIFPLLAKNERLRVEQMVVGLGATGAKVRRELARRRRDAILSRLRGADLVSREAKNLRPKETRAKRVSTEGLPTTGWVGDEDWDVRELRQAGADPGAPSHEQLRQLVADTRALVSSDGRAPVRTDAADVLHRLEEGIRQADPATHPAVLAFATEALANVASNIARGPVLDCTGELGRTVLRIAQEAAEHPEPSSASEAAQEDAQEVLIGRGPRAHAATALLGLARSASCIDEKVRALLRRLATDPVPGVRSAVAQWVNAVIDDPELLWALSEYFARTETNHSIVEYFLVSFVNPARRDPVRAAKLIGEVLDRKLGSAKIDERAFFLLAVLYVQANDGDSRSRLEGLADDPARSFDAAGELLGYLRYRLVTGLTTPSAQEPVERRARAQNLFRRLCVSLSREFDELVAAQHERRAYDTERARSIARLIDDAANQLRFAAEIEADKGGPLTDAGRRIFYQEMKDVVAVLGRCGLPAVVHTLLELLEEFVDVDPRGVWRLFSDISKAGLTRGYQQESLGMTKVETIVRRYLRDHRDVLEATPEAQEALVDILDAFVGVGWPSARRLAYQLDELFR